MDCLEEMTLQEDPQAEYSFSKPLSKSKKTSGSKKNEEKEDSTETKKSRERRRNTVGGSQF